MESRSFKLARIRRSVEESLGFSLTSDSSIYMDSEDADKLARSRPKDYLDFLERLKKMIQEPDFALVDPEFKRIAFANLFYHEHGFEPFFVGITRKGKPQKWYFSYIEWGSHPLTDNLMKNADFIRVKRKNPGRKPSSKGCRASS